MKLNFRHGLLQTFDSIFRLSNAVRCKTEGYIFIPPLKPVFGDWFYGSVSLILPFLSICKCTTCSIFTTSLCFVLYCAPVYQTGTWRCISPDSNQYLKDCACQICQINQNKVCVNQKMGKASSTMEFCVVHNQTCSCYSEGTLLWEQYVF